MCVLLIDLIMSVTEMNFLLKISVYIYMQTTLAAETYLAEELTIARQWISNTEKAMTHLAIIRLNSIQLYNKM